jgi:hypothetical protein
MNAFDLLIVGIIFVCIAKALYAFLKNVLLMNAILVSLFLLSITISYYSFDKELCVRNHQHKVFCNSSDNQYFNWAHQELMNSDFLQHTASLMYEITTAFSGEFEFIKMNKVFIFDQANYYWDKVFDGIKHAIFKS